MIICLSSGYTPLYLDGVVESLGMPVDSKTDFRYTIAKSVSKSVMTHEEKGSLKLQAVLICYVDQSDTNREPEIVPIRYATIVGHERADAGRLRLKLRYGKWAYSDDLAQFQKELARTASFQAKEALPSWHKDRPIADQPVGCHCFETPDDLSSLSILETADWNKVAIQLAFRKDFIELKRFYRLHGITTLKRVPVKSKDGIFSLKSKSTYVIQLFYFVPDRIKADPEQLKVGASERISPIGANVEDIPAIFRPGPARPSGDDMTPGKPL